MSVDERQLAWIQRTSTLRLTATTMHGTSTPVARGSTLSNAACTPKQMSMDNTLGITVTSKEMSSWHKHENFEISNCLVVMLGIGIYDGMDDLIGISKIIKMYHIFFINNLVIQCYFLMKIIKCSIVIKIQIQT